MIKLVLSVLILLTTSACYAQSDFQNKNPKSNLNDTLNTDKIGWLNPSRLTPFSFLELMKKKGSVNDKLGIVTMMDSFPDNWISRKYVSRLMKLINSKEKCNCFVNLFSSYIPNDSADIGGYAVKLINAYKKEQKPTFGLYSCPKTNQQDVDILNKWWTKRQPQPLLKTPSE